MGVRTRRLIPLRAVGACGRHAHALDLVGRAEQNTRAMLESMLRSLGYTQVSVTFRDPQT